ncbi:dual specificity protein phosphatase family protein [Candidatus Pacearchaeota archaeon]|nr:dual specificity protein phosphatase family protein [Candidatus Pacearchaeota archaeon]
MRKKLHKEKSEFEYSKITPNIYIGTNKCCITHFKKTLLSKGITADISLEEIRLDHPFGVDYYLWLPTKDHKAPTMKQMIIGTYFIKWLIENDIKVYIHCRQGHTRAPTLAAAYFISEGMDVADAIKKIKSKRPSAHPTPSQIKALKKFKTYIEKRG